jgi:transposase
LPPQCVTCLAPQAIADGTAGKGAELGDLLPHLGSVIVDKIETTPSAVRLTARYWPAAAACPACGTWSSRVHSSYVRQVRDLPLGGRPVLIHLATRRFLCPNPACPKVTFAGQADGLTARYQRWSVPLAGLLTHVALELAGARLARALGVAVHRGTLLRLVIDLPDPALRAAPDVVGVDDFALRRGHVYATVLVDATTGQAIDVLPTSFAKMMTKRTGQHDLAGWLGHLEADDQPELHTFATGIRQDLAAVTAALTLPYSSGSTEGNVNRIKAIKRQMYGRASLDLLRKRVIHHPP